MKYWFFTIQRAPKRDTVSNEFALSVLQQHTAYFKQLGSEGKCLMAGPFVLQPASEDLGAGCFVLAATDEASARGLAETDPLVREGLYSFKMWEWTKVVPEN